MSKGWIISHSVQLNENVEKKCCSQVVISGILSKVVVLCMDLCRDSFLDCVENILSHWFDFIESNLFGTSEEKNGFCCSHFFFSTSKIHLCQTKTNRISVVRLYVHTSP